MIICTIYRNKKRLGQVNTADYPELDTINVGGHHDNTVVLRAEPPLPDHLFALSRLDGTFWLVSTGELPLAENGETLSESMLKPGRIFQLGPELELVISGEENPSEYALLFRAGKKMGWLPLDNGGNLLGGFCETPESDVPTDEQLHFCCRCEINHAAITIASLDPQHPVRFRGLELEKPRTINPEELFYPARGVQAKVVLRQNIDARLKLHDPFYPQKLQWIVAVLLSFLALLGATWFYNQSSVPVESGREFTFDQATPQFPKDPAAQPKFLEELEKSWFANLQRDIYGKALADIRNMLENQELPPEARKYFERREKEIQEVRAAIRLAKYAESRSQIYAIANIAKHYTMPIPGRSWVATSESDLVYWETLLARLNEAQQQLAPIDRLNARRGVKILQKSATQIEQLVKFSKINQAMYTAYGRSDYFRTAELLRSNPQFVADLQLFAGYPAFRRRLDLDCAVTRLNQETMAPGLTPAQAAELLKNCATVEKQLAETPLHAPEFPLEALRSQLDGDRQALQQLLHFHSLWSLYQARRTTAELYAALGNALQLGNTRYFAANEFFRKTSAALEKEYFNRLQDTATPLVERHAMIQAMKIPLNLNPLSGRRVAALESELLQTSQARCLELYNRYQQEPANRPALLRELRTMALPGSSFYDWAARQNVKSAPVKP